MRLNSDVQFSILFQSNAYVLMFYIGFNKHNKMLLFSRMALQPDCGPSLEQAVFHLWRDKLWQSESLVSTLRNTPSGDKRRYDWFKGGAVSLRHRMCSLHIHGSLFCQEASNDHIQRAPIHVLLKAFHKKLLCHSIVENFISCLNHIVASSNIYFNAKLGKNSSFRTMSFHLNGYNCHKYFSYAVSLLKLILTKLPIAEQLLVFASTALNTYTFLMMCTKRRDRHFHLDPRK